MPAKVFFKFFIVSSSARLTSSPSVSWLSGLSLGRSGCFLTAEVALLVAETELVSEAENIKKNSNVMKWWKVIYASKQTWYKGEVVIKLNLSQKYTMLWDYISDWGIYRGDHAC